MSVPLPAFARLVVPPPVPNEEPSAMTALMVSVPTVVVIVMEALPPRASTPPPALSVQPPVVNVMAPTSMLLVTVIAAGEARSNTALFAVNRLALLDQAVVQFK